MVWDVRAAKLAAQGPDYELTEGEKGSLRFRRSIFAIREIKAGEPFTEENLRVIRPGYGIAPKYYKDLLGKAAKRDIGRGEPLLPEDL